MKSKMINSQSPIIEKSLKSFAIMLSLLAAISNLKGQDMVDIFGYFETQMMGSQVDTKYYNLYTNKLRVDLQAYLSDQIYFGANFDYITYHGKTEWNVLDFLSSDITSEIPEGMQRLYTIEFSDETFLDNAYLKLTFKYFDLIAGKQQISLGTGYVWNPIDVFNIKDPLDPTYEQPGHNAVRLDVPLAALYSLSLLVSPEENWTNSGKLIRFKGSYSRFDYSFIYIENVWTFHDYTSFDFENLSFKQLPEKRQLLGFSTAGEFLGLGVWAEYAFDKMEVSSDFYEVVIGTDYTLDFQTYIMMEYYRNTLGKNSYKEYDLNDWMRLFTAEQKAISRDQLYIFIQHPATDLLNLGVSSIYSISDKSIALVPTLIYSLSDNVDLFGYLSFNFGKEGTVYAQNQGSGALIRARVYF